MTKVIEERMTAQIEGDFVVFLIGVRINKFWKVHKWLPVIMAMPRMIRELESLPSSETGFLGHNGISTRVTVQYWRSFDHLEAYALSKDHTHLTAWTAFNRRMKSTRADVGIWHETYLVKAQDYEAVYSGMPPYGLARAGELISVTDSRSKARMRLGH